VKKWYITLKMEIKYVVNMFYVRDALLKCNLHDQLKNYVLIIIEKGVKDELQNNYSK
jgi:hypothetical protein